MKPTIHRPVPPVGAPKHIHKQNAAPLLPNERDECVGDVAPAPDPKLVQAKKDLDAGRVDTDMWATPGLDAARRESLVPGAGGKPVNVVKKKKG